MLYAIAHFLRDNIPWLWDMVDILNSFLFSLRYGAKLKDAEANILSLYAHESGMMVVPMNKVPTEKLVQFFANQPEEAYTFFKPHGFDAKSIKKLQKNKSFLAFILLTKDDDLSGAKYNVSQKNIGEVGKIAAYCFIRSFFYGKGFRGRMVGIDQRGRGLGTLMNKMINGIGFGIGLRLFETVSKDNVASYHSTLSASNVKIIEEMEHNELFLEVLPE